VYLHKGTELPATEVFFIGDRLCHRDLTEYLIEPENDTESEYAYFIVTQLAEKHNVQTYSSCFFARKIEKIDGKWMETRRPIFIIQVTTDTPKNIKKIVEFKLRELLGEIEKVE